MVNSQFLALCLGILGIIGIIFFVTLACLISWYYRGNPASTFRGHWRSIRMKQLLMVASLFFLAMAASYGVLQNAWALLYLIVAIKTGTWWFRIAVTQHA